MNRQHQRAVWRRDLVTQREAFSTDLHTAASQSILDHLWDAWPVPPATVVGWCWPVRGEVDVWPLFERWRRVRSVRAVLPVVVAPKQPLIFREWSEGVPLNRDCHGIPYPVAGEPLSPGFLLLPVNGFDAKGYRLGYGGGYFDRTLAGLLPRPFTVGIGFEFQRLPTTLPGDHDIPLDALVTEAGLFRPSSRDSVDRRS
ncbi:MAG: 5-formyltetrahydrofolate cyclo-ligase [Pseudomonadota bacterium]